MKLGAPILILLIASFVPLTFASSATLNFDSQSVLVEYEASSLDVQSTTHTSNSLIFSISTNADATGSFIVTLNRDLIDSIKNDQDIAYIVTVNDFPSNFDETSTTTISRTLNIPIEMNSYKIEIVGTVVHAPDSESMESNDTKPDTSVVNTTSDTDDAMINDNDFMTKPDDALISDNEMETVIDTIMQPDDCGYGTVLSNDGVMCIVESKPTSLFRDTIFGTGAGLIISFIIIIIMYPISRASKS